jgi:hypothetical protein
MTQKEKQLLLKDLCARLPYNVVVRCTDSDTDYKCFLTTDILHEIQNGYEYYDYRPYLRPMSSMTSEEWVEFCDCSLKDEASWVLTENSQRLIPTQNREDYLNSKHFDYRGLIPMGLALEAPADMYKAE